MTLINSTSAYRLIRVDEATNIAGSNSYYLEIYTSLFTSPVTLVGCSLEINGVIKKILKSCKVEETSDGLACSSYLYGIVVE